MKFEAHKKQQEEKLIEIELEFDMILYVYIIALTAHEIDLVRGYFQ